MVVEALLLAMAAATVVLLAVLMVMLVRRSGDVSAAAEVTRQLREQLGDATRRVDDLGQQVSTAQAEAREQTQATRAQSAEAQAKNLEVLQQQVTQVVDLMGKQLAEVRTSLGDGMQNVNKQLAGSSEVIGDVKKQLGVLGETAKNIQELGKDISSLQDILKAPKLRGNLGELFLEEILRQVLPADSYEMQYRMPGADKGSNVVVDAVVHLGDRMVPIDSKFPLESFQRLLTGETDEERVKLRKAFVDAVKKQVDEIADRYIRPDVGTYEFALMYLPAENVYYEAVIRDEGTDGVVAYAARKKVIPVSPNTLYAYLLTIAYGLKGMQIGKQAEAIRGQLEAFQKKFGKFFEVFGKVGRNMDLAQKHYEDASKRAEKLNDQVGKITGTVTDLEEIGGEEARAQLELPEA